LLEQTVVEAGSTDNKPVVSQENNNKNTVSTDEETENQPIQIDGSHILSVSDSKSGVEFETNSQIIAEAVFADKIEFETNQTVPSEQSPSGIEFYRKRAIEEVSFLQMVEHVFAGIEREQMKIVPKPFDDLEVKKVLHTFLQVSKETNTNGQAQAEFQLLQETENWYSALTHRDKRISINHLRRYCETTRPPLSAPALVALARFYRNSPYSEPVRGKFDFVITRLFSRDIENDRREMVFSREELIKHLKEFYAEWSSIPLYPTDSDDSEILLIALKFEDFITEAAIAGNFDELIKNDFFNRLRLFKKNINENFFSPLVVAADIESNIKIGNSYVELLEKEKSNKSTFEDKYGFLHDQTISDATGKTYQLVELLSRTTGESKAVESKSVETLKEVKKETKPEAKMIKEKSKSESYSNHKEERQTQKNYFAVNKWLLTATIFTVFASLGLYFWANSNDIEAKGANVISLNLDNSSLKENIQTARISGDIFYGVVLPSWDDLAQVKKEDILKKIVSIGAEKGFKKVQLLNNKGKTVGFAAGEKVEVSNP
jgi:hypothetical protein